MWTTDMMCVGMLAMDQSIDSVVIKCFVSTKVTQADKVATRKLVMNQSKLNTDASHLISK